MKDYLISVIIPCYNCSHYIQSTLESVLQNDLLDIEILLINDGSNDDTLTKIKKILSNKLNKQFLNNIKIINQNNAGVSSARNKGIICAKGEYIVFIDSDDIISNDYFYNLKKIIVTAKYDLILMGYYFRNGDNASYAYYPPLKIKTKNNLDTIKEVVPYFLGYDGKKILNQQWGGVYRCIFSKNVLTKNNLFFNEKIRICEDEIFIVQYLINANSVTYFDAGYYYYTIRNSGSMISTLKNRDLVAKNSIDILTDLNKTMDILNEKGYMKFIDYFCHKVFFFYTQFLKNSQFSFYRQNKYILKQRYIKSCIYSLKSYSSIKEKILYIIIRCGLSSLLVIIFNRYKRND